MGSTGRFQRHPEHGQCSDRLQLLLCDPLFGNGNFGNSPGTVNDTAEAMLVLKALNVSSDITGAFAN